MILIRKILEKKQTEMRGRGEINSNVPKKASLLFSVCILQRLRSHWIFSTLSEICSQWVIWITTTWSFTCSCELQNGRKSLSFLHLEPQWWHFAAVVVIVIHANNNLAVPLVHGAVMAKIAGCARTLHITMNKKSRQNIQYNAKDFNKFQKRTHT